jgi:hypothetical protein
MYLRKASLDQRPSSMIVYTGIPLRYMAIAVDERSECRPQSSALMFKDSLSSARKDCRSITRADRDWRFANVPFS